MVPPEGARLPDFLLVGGFVQSNDPLTNVRKLRVFVCKSKLSGVTQHPPLSCFVVSPRLNALQRGRVPS